MRCGVVPRALEYLQISFKWNIHLFLIYYMSLCPCMGHTEVMYTEVRRHLLSTMWVLGIEVRTAGLATKCVVV